VIDRLAIDANAAIDLLRPQRPDPPPLQNVITIVLPLPVLGELLAGAMASAMPRINLERVTGLRKRSEVLIPDEKTAWTYGSIRAATRNVQPLGQSKLNDFWIAALCLQHNLPLLTNDSGFDRIPALRVIHW